MQPALGLLLSYLLGSIPAAYIAGKITRGIDLRQHGSGNLGATNAYRVLGARIAVVVFVVDVAKGLLPVLLLPQWLATDRPASWAIAYGAAAVLGHARPVFLGFRSGGKGVATSTGVFLALAWLPTVLSFGLWLAVLLATGFVSLASLVAAVALVVALYVSRGMTQVFIAGALVAAFVIWGHRANIRRLLRGEEHRFGRMAKLRGHASSETDRRTSQEAPAAPGNGARTA
jgi:acyl phosphate:glycerol-3-phosphate acyltransferase